MWQCRVIHFNESTIVEVGVGNGRGCVCVAGKGYMGTLCMFLSFCSVTLKLLLKKKKQSLCERSLKVKVKSLSHVRLFATPWIVAHQAPLFLGFSRHDYCSGLPFPSPGDLPDPGIKPRSPVLWTDALISEPPGKFERGLTSIKNLA